uniref:Uncharacterized protein n=1 Tax=Rhodococcus sp. T104 TaxID=230533 RepID=B6VJI3_9NOCA|nr:hypothetical protein [Rhodococcus sp. T104]
MRPGWPRSSRWRRLHEVTFRFPGRGSAEPTAPSTMRGTLKAAGQSLVVRLWLCVRHLPPRPPRRGGEQSAALFIERAACRYPVEDTYIERPELALNPGGVDADGNLLTARFAAKSLHWSHNERSVGLHTVRREPHHNECWPRSKSHLGGIMRYPDHAERSVAVRKGIVEHIREPLLSRTQPVSMCPITPVISRPSQRKMV